MQNQISVSAKYIGLAIATLFVAAAVSAASFAYAADASYTYYDTYTPSNSSSGSYTYYDTYTPSSNSNSSYTYYDTYTPSNSSSGSYTYYDTYTPSKTSTKYTYYDTYTPKYTTPTYTHYTYTNPGCTSNCGGGGGCKYNCNPPPKPAPTCTMSVSKSSIHKGESVVITWSSSNALSGSISNIGSVTLNGSITVYPQETTTYVGTFKGHDNKTVTCSTSVGVLPPPVCPTGYSGTYPNCVPPQPAPSCTIIISNYNNNGYYHINQPVTITWTSNNAQYGWINNGLGQVTLNGSRVVYPTQTTTYTGTFTGYNGQSVNCSVTINIINPPVIPQTPIVTLSQTPYTGLELGPVGTFLYWAFIVGWCLIAAYLIAIKKLHNQVYHSLHAMLFGTATSHAHSAHSAHVAHVSYNTPVVRNEEKTDDFILSQISRIR